VLETPDNCTPWPPSAVTDEMTPSCTLFTESCTLTMPTGKFCAIKGKEVNRERDMMNFILMLFYFLPFYFFTFFTLDTQLVKHRDETLVETFVSTNTLREGHIDDVVVAYAYHHVALTLKDSLDGSHTRAAGQDAVAS